MTPIRRTIRPIDTRRVRGDIVLKFQACMAEGRMGRASLGEVTPLISGGTTTVHKSLLTNGAGEIPVVLKIWTRDHRPGRYPLRVHNNYVALKRLKEEGALELFDVPEIHFSVLELIDGRLLILPRYAQIDETSEAVRVIRNQLVVFDYLDLGPTLDGTKNIPPELIERFERELELIVKLMGGEDHRGLKSYEILSALFRKNTDDFGLVFANIDMLDQIIVPQIPTFRIKL